MWVAKLHTDQTVGSSVMNARVVTRCLGKPGPPSLLPILSGVGVGKGWDRYRLGHPAVEVLADDLMYSQATVRSYTKDRAVLRWDHTLKRGRV